MSRPRPFGPHERQIAARFLRASSSEGGISAMTWISLAGITLAVFALVLTLAVRSGFRAEFVSIVLQADAHASIFAPLEFDAEGRPSRDYHGYDAAADALGSVPGVVRAAPLVRQEAVVFQGDEVRFAQVYGIRAQDFMDIPRMADQRRGHGDLSRFEGGRNVIAIGDQLSFELGVGVGDKITLLTPKGVPTPFGIAPRDKPYEVIWIFDSGSSFIDRGRVFLPFAEAQSFFNRDGVADLIEVIVNEPEAIDSLRPDLHEAAGAGVRVQTWRDSNASYLRALDLEDTVMFVLLSVLVLVASMSITSGLIMLVKNKQRDIGILRSMGFTEGSVLRIFFLCGAVTGVLGTVLGVALGVAAATWLNEIFGFIDWLAGRAVWDPDQWAGVERLPATLRLWDVLSAAGLALGLSFLVTLPPARRAARMNPVEALRNE